MPPSLPLVFPSSPIRALVIGIGNPSRGDDALGHLLIDALQTLQTPGLRLQKAPPDPTSLFDLWKGEDLVFLVDAIHSDAPAGSLHRFHLTQTPLPRTVSPASSHHWSLAEAIEMARSLSLLPPSLWIYGIEASSFEIGAPPSPILIKHLPALLHVLLRHLRTPSQPPTQGSFADASAFSSYLLPPPPFQSSSKDLPPPSLCSTTLPKALLPQTSTEARPSFSSPSSNVGDLMHEFSLLSGLLRQIQEIAYEHQAERILEVHIWLGALTDISPDHFREHFDEAVQGSALEGVRLSILQDTDPTNPRAQEILIESIDIEEADDLPVV